MRRNGMGAEQATVSDRQPQTNEVDVADARTNGGYSRERSANLVRGGEERPMRIGESQSNGRSM